MSTHGGYEAEDNVTMPQDMAAEFARLDARLIAQERAVLYSEFFVGLGSLLMGPASYFEAAPPFTPNDIILRVLSEPTPKPTYRRVSVTAISSGSTFEQLTGRAMVDHRSPDTSQTASLMDHFIDTERRCMRGSEGIIDKTPEGRWRMDKRRPTFLDRTNIASDVDNAVVVRRGAKFESEFFSLPLMSAKRESMYLKRMLAFQPFLTPMFQEAVTLQFDYPQNNVTY